MDVEFRKYYPSVTNKGGTMMNDFDDISVKEIKNGLDTKILGQNVLFFDKIDSTNIKAKNLAKNGEKEGTLIIAEEQSDGRGRLERKFVSPKGKGLWFSIILRPKFKITDAPKCTLLAAVAVALAIDEEKITPEIKWPNDIVKGKKKLAGILTELTTNANNSYAVIIGVGINVNMENFSEDLSDIATSLAIIKGEKIERAKFLQRVLFFMEKLYLTAQTEGFDEILNLWRKYSTTLNKDIRVINAGDKSEITGRAVDIEDDGALLVKVDGKITKVLAGDVSVRGL